ncbi:unnamed protein product, partial [Closterium sp. NIES-54]
MEVARTSMIYAAAPHFLWLFAVRYAAHQLNLWPYFSEPETSPTLWWTGKVCDAPVFRFYHPHERRVFSSQDVIFDESVCFYRLHPHASHPVPLAPLFLVPVPPLVDLLPPQGPAPSEGEGSWGAVTGGADSGGAASPRGGGAVGDLARGLGAGQPQQPDLLETLSPQQICAGGAAGAGGTNGGAAGAGGTRGAAGAGGARAASLGGTGGARAASLGGTGGAGAAGPRGALTGGTGAARAGGAAGAGGAARGAAGTGGARAGGTGGTGAAKAGGAAGTRGAGPAGAGGTTGAGGARTRGAGAAGASGAAGAAGIGGTSAGGTGGIGAADGLADRFSTRSRGYTFHRLTRPFA